MKRTFAIGDIHGCLDKLQALVEKIPIDGARDRLLFIGDYIDRGPDSYEVVEYLVQLRQRFADIVFLKGNHEDMLLNYLAGRDRLTYLHNGGQLTLDAYLRRSNALDEFPIPKHHLDFFNALRLHYQTEDFLFVHAGLRHGRSLEDQDTQDLLWIREDFIFNSSSFGKRVVFGHTPFERPRVEPNKIGIDTGAVYGNVLTCVQLPELEFFSA